MTAIRRADSKVGLLLVYGHGARLDEWHRGGTQEIEHFDMGDPMADKREMRGPAASHPTGASEGAPGFRSSQQRDLYDRRLEDHRVAFVRDAAARALVVARERAWPFMLVLGDPHLSEPATEVLRHGGVEVEREDRVLGWMSHHDLAKAVGPDVERLLLGLPAHDGHK